MTQSNGARRKGGLLVAAACLVALYALEQPGRCRAGLIPDSRSFPAYRLSFGQTGPSSPVILKLARNEVALFLLEVDEPRPEQLKVVLGKPPAAAGVEIRVWQLRPLPAHLPAPWRADALVPLEPTLVVSHRPCYLAVRLFVSPSQPAGHYSLRLAVAGSRGTAALPLHLRVWKFALPAELPVTLMANFRPSREWFRRYGVAGEEQFVQVCREYLRILREYRVNAVAGLAPLASAVSRSPQPSAGPPELSRLLEVALKELGYRRIRLPALAGCKTQGPDLAALDEDLKGYFSTMVRHLAGRGWLDRALVKLWDEPPPESFPEVAQVYQRFKAAVPQVRTECTGFPPSPELARIVDIWTVAAPCYEPRAMAAARSQGQEIWFYHNRLQGADQPPACQRLIGWQTFFHRFSGYYLWGVNVWPEDPWTQIPGAASRSRRGTFLYPHPRTGRPLPSLRLEAWRQGFQDYQYFLLMETAAHQDRVVAASWPRLWRQVALWAADLSGTQPAPPWAAMETLRLEMGELLEQSAGQSRSGPGSKKPEGIEEP